MAVISKISTKNFNASKPVEEIDAAVPIFDGQLSGSGSFRSRPA
jgi:hypothetical protein